MRQRLFGEIECILILGLREKFSRLVISFLIEFSGLIGEVVDVDTRGRTTLIFFMFLCFVCFCLIRVVGRFFSQ